MLLYAAAADHATFDLQRSRTIVYGECCLDLSSERSMLCTNRTAVSMLSALMIGVLFFNMVYMCLVG